MACLGASLLAAPPKPKVLVFEPKTSGKADKPLDPAMANYLAEELDADGKLTPIVYGPTDPLFRAAAENGSLKSAPDWPTFREGLEISSELGAKYALVYEKKPGSYKATLYFDGRKIWSEPSNLTVRNSHGTSASLTGQSVARTWVSHMSTGPLRTLVAQQPLRQPAEATGQQPKPLEPLPATAVEDDDQIRSEVQRFIQSNDMPRAVTLLRDAVDRRPFDVDRRILLVQTLLDARQFNEAGEEADRAVLMAPDRPELRALAAKAWIGAGKKDEARSALNEAIARDPTGSKTRLMLAEISLARSETDTAREHLDLLIKQHPTRTAYYLRSLCRAIVGDTEGLNQDLAAWQKLPESETEADSKRHYVLAAQTLDDDLKKMGDGLRTLMSKALVHPDNQLVQDEVAQDLKLVQARSSFLTSYSTPFGFKSSSERRILAHQLLVQCLLSLKSFCSGGGPDAMTDARVDLGEALKEAAGSRSAFEEEQKSAVG